jgi:3-hydroxyacyl-CoA dehydrogenase / 3-hydroxy-2-methylbutyryl-CoA dehydrogenase
VTDMTQKLTGAALISGGASGLGEATARRLHAEGMTVTIADRNAELGDALVAQLGDRAAFVELDVTNSDAVMTAAHAAGDGVDGGLRMTVACAGIGGAERLVSKRGTHNPDNFRRIIEVNLIGTYNLLRAGAEVMSANEPIDGQRGVHVSTASVAAFDGQIGQLSYSASKGGVVGMTLPAARDLARHGIRVCTIAPGLFETPLLGGLPEPAREALGAQVPFPPRLGQPEEYADLVVAIARNQMLNGEVIRLDGAIRMSPQ